MTAANVALRFIAPGDVEGLKSQFLEVYRGAFAGPPYNRPEAVAHSFAESLVRHSRREGFRCLAAVDESHGQVVGFAYGYTSAAGQWWHDLVAYALGPQLAAQWLEGAFELAEFAVAPSAQGRGLGTQLHDQVLAGLPHSTAMLSTMQTETVALRLYRRRGWQTLLENFHFPGGTRPFLVMGRQLKDG